MQEDLSLGGEPGAPVVGGSPPQMTQWPFQQPFDIDEWRGEQKILRRKGWKALITKLGALCTLALMLYLAVALAVLIYMSPEVLDELLDPAANRSDAIFIITPEVTTLFRISGPALALFFSIMAGAILISYALIAWRSRGEFPPELLEGKSERASAIFTAGTLFIAVLFFTQIFYSLADLGGADPNVPPFEEEMWEKIYIFTKASVWEEVISRILLIGVPLLFIDFLFRRERMLDPADYLFGGKFKLEAVESLVILFSSIMFALAHLEGWDIWKTIPSGLAGLCFGFLFVRFGLYAAIFFHFAFDFLSIPVDFFDSPALFVPLGLTILLWLACGAAFFLIYANRLLMFIRSGILTIISPAPHRQ